jgi:hypothetical protein
MILPIVGWGHVVGLGTTLQAGRLRVRFPMVSLEFFIYITVSNRNVYQEYILGKRGRGVKARCLKKIW